MTKKKFSYNYEMMVILPPKEEEKREKLVEEIKKVVASEEIKLNLENKKLAYKIGEWETADYLLFHFNTTPEKVTQVEKIVQQIFVIRYLLINLDKEAKIKVRERKKSKRDINQSDFSESQSEKIPSADFQQ